MKILVINCGSSSLKYQLIDMENESVLAKGLCERIGIAGSKLTHQAAGKDKYVVEKDMPTHKTAIELVMEALMDQEHGVIKDTSEISAIGHRVLHGGTVYSDSIVVNDDVKRVIRECFELGPLHNPANLMGIEACEEAMPGTPNVAVFDTASVCPCRRRLILMRSLTSIMRSMASAATASTEPATSSYLPRRSSSADWTRRRRK